ncbi:MAG: RNA polymerase sigma factor, partial [Saprospiraceae bacterium]
MTPTKDIIGALHAGKLDAVDELYVHHREAFFNWAGKRFDANRQDFEDAWQEAVIALYTQVMSGKLTALRYDARTWLLAVGYKRLLNNNRKVKRILWKDPIDETLQQVAFRAEVQEKQSHTEKKETLHAAMKTMSSQCRDMLVQRYYQEKSIEEIQEDFELSNANTTSATLSRCLKRLKEL